MKTVIILLFAILLLASCENDLEKVGYKDGDAVLMTDSKGNMFVVQHDIGDLYTVKYIKP